MRKIFVLTIAVVMIFGLSVKAGAALTKIGTATYNSSNYNLIYDNDFGITWLDYTNGTNTWQNQLDWADGLNTAGVLTYNFNPGTSMSWSGDWRLPATLQPDSSCNVSGYNCVGSEWGHLYYTELGNVAYGGLDNTGDFQSLVEWFYWTGTEYAPYTYNAWSFEPQNGSQNNYGKPSPLYAIAVRPGLAVVPEPISYILFVTGGTLFAGKRYLKRKRTT